MPDEPGAVADRRRVYDAVVATPGLAAREIQRAVTLDWGATSLHLLRLEEAGHLLRVRGQAQEFYFARAVATAPGATGSLGGSAAAVALVATLLESPDATLDELAERLHGSPGSIAPVLRAARSAGAVGEGRRGELRTYRVADRGEAGRIVAAPRGAFGRYVDRVVELWGELFAAG